MQLGFINGYVKYLVTSDENKTENYLNTCINKENFSCSTCSSCLISQKETGLCFGQCGCNLLVLNRTKMYPYPR